MLKLRKKLGKYRILKRLGEGGFAAVYKAFDTVEGIPVALKVPYPSLLTDQTVEAFKKEVRLTAKLDHPNILRIKNAEFVEGKLVVAYPLGDGTLADRLHGRISVETALDFAGQILEALAYAHERRIIHCDVKPENLLLFPGERLRLTDFGISKIARRTMQASGSGTVGYVAPEQAMGKPSFRSDVFSAGVILYQMFTNVLPEWPYEWPLPGVDRLRRKLPPEFVDFLRRCLEVHARRRFCNADRMLAAFRRLLPRVRRFREKRRNKTPTTRRLDWKQIRTRQFLQQYRGALRLTTRCSKCRGPMSMSMAHCPWCGTGRPKHRGNVEFPARCPRCGRGRKLDWKYCAWCYGPAFRDISTRRYTDVRYQAKCKNRACPRKDLMPHSRYCPWCRKKVERAWPLAGTSERCKHCRSGVAGSFWEYCPWCGRSLGKSRRASRSRK